MRPRFQGCAEELGLHPEGDAGAPGRPASRECHEHVSVFEPPVGKRAEC